MDSVFTSLVIFGLILVGTVLGWLLAAALPQPHLSSDSKDAIKVGIAMVATLSALVLGLLTASAKSGLDTKQQEVRTMASEIAALDRILVLYGPDAAKARETLKATTGARIAAVWPDEAGNVDIGAVSAGAGVEDVIRAILALSPSSDSEHWLQSKALSLASDISSDRWTMASQAASTIQWPFVGVVTFWLAIVFASFTLFAPRNASVAMAMLISALSVAGAFYLIIEMDQPYSGLIRISSEPIRAVYAGLGGS